MLDFGNEYLEWTSGYPEADHFNEVPSYKRVKLKAIHYRNVNGVGYLSDIQL